MHLLLCDSIASAHEKIINYVIWNHRIVQTEDNEKTWESNPISIEIRTPLQEKMIHVKSSFQKQRCDEYAHQLIYGTSATFDYTYHERLFAYGEYKINQIDKLIDHIKKESLTRRAIAITWIPEKDTNTIVSVPCLQFVQFIQRDGKLNMVVLFRSNDILQAIGGNMYALVRLLDHVSNLLGLRPGSYTHIISIPHLYPVRDASELKKWM